MSSFEDYYVSIKDDFNMSELKSYEKIWNHQQQIITAKDKKIAELESEYGMLQDQYIGMSEEYIAPLEFEIKSLTQKLNKLTECGVGGHNNCICIRCLNKAELDGMEERE